LSYLRLLKRKSSFEPGQDLEQVIKTEFWDSERSVPDLSLSVFEVDLATKLLQTNAEFAAGNGINLPRKRAGVDCRLASGWDNAIVTATGNSLMDFTFTSQHHRELQFSSDQELNGFVESLRAASTTLEQVSDKDTAQYGNQQYSSGDPEWRKICELSDRVKAWVTTGKP
jgi:hypothetical protein